MNIHKNARTTVHSRAEIVRRVLHQGQPVRGVATAFGISERTVRKWVARRDAVADRSSRPHASPDQTPGELQELIERLRRQRWTGAEIARALALSPATVARYLRRRGLARLRALEPPTPVIRYAYRHPGALVHVDIKKLGRIGRPGHRIHGDRRTRVRGIGWEFVHVAVDDATRLAYVEVLDDEKATTAIGFLRRAIAFYATHGITAKELLTDNGGAYRSTVHAIACRALGIRHLRTRPYRPQTNGKAERFIRTMLGGWAYGAIYRNSAERTAALPGWLERYNWRRPHGALNHKPPGTRLAELNNLLGSYN